MLQQGDEFGRSQSGNNNAYCQDNSTSWVDWDLSGDARSLFEFARDALSLRNDRPEFRCDRFYSASDVVWRRADGRELTRADWHSPARHAVAMQVRGDEDLGDLFMIFNAGAHARAFLLPAPADGRVWSLRLDSSASARHLPGAPELLVPAHSVVVLDEPETSQ
jgi:glycogen operon protein